MVSVSADGVPSEGATRVRPERVDAVDPSDTEVLPMVMDELASLALAMLPASMVLVTVPVSVVWTTEAGSLAAARVPLVSKLASVPPDAVAGAQAVPFQAITWPEVALVCASLLRAIVEAVVRALGRAVLV